MFSEPLKSKPLFTFRVRFAPRALRAVLLVVLLAISLSASLAFAASLETTETTETTATPTPPPIKATKITLDARELLFGAAGQKLTLNVTVSPKNADVRALTFTSSKPDIAEVNAKGQVTARRKGKCTITAKLDKLTVSCKVTITDKWVALTFDDGPSPYTAKLLNGLKKRGVYATFFVPGRAASKHGQSMLRIMKRDGHEVGNHVWGHDSKAKNLRARLAKVDKYIKLATGKESALMRPPYGILNKRVRTCGKPVILWSIDTNDWRDRNSSIVYGRITKQAKSGSIILLHDTHKTSVSAALKAVDTLKKRGYAFVTVSDLLGAPENNKVYFKGPSKIRPTKIK